MLNVVDILMTRRSQYGVLFHFTRKLYEAFVRARINVRLLEGDDIIRGPAKNRPQLTIGFNGAPRDASQQMFCHQMRIPHLSLLVDPPYRFFYLMLSPYTIIGCDDRTGCQMLKSLDFHRTMFLPHAVEPELLETPTNQDKHDEVVLLATFIDYKGRRKAWKQKYPKAICKLMDDAIERTFSEPYVSFMFAFDEAISDYQKKHSTAPYDSVLITDVLQDLEMYVKGRDRALLAESIQDIPLHVFGGTVDKLDWKTYLGKKHPHIHVHDPVEYPHALSIMQNAKIVLNPALKNKDGAHERVFSGLACGALVVTNESAYLNETFKGDQGLIYYKHGHLDNLTSTLVDYLNNDNKRVSHVSRGKDIVKQHHTWDKRVEMIMKEVPPFLESMIYEMS